ncbi:peptidylprolyl isomerase [Mesobacillus harenae]|uniref:peptidylprolyl isomerase n=1 Tax=Mesobacillus harenae TaxID=2213203 RepID=UPI0015803DC1|nr:peptidylprolyl isomerase [Mesobacillus harenae]
MKKWILSLSLAAGVISLSACNNDDNGNSEVVVSSDAGNITQQELYEVMKERYGQQTLQELLYTKVLSDKYEVTDDELTEKVEELKAELGPNFDQVLASNQIADEEELKEVLKDQLLMEKAALKDVEATEEEIQARYEEYKPEIKARHILVKDKAKAEEIKAELDNGGNFEELATEHSTDTLSAEQGGDLGFFGPGKMVPEFEEAAYSLDVNEISEPVETQHGWHIIQVTEKKEKQSFEEMKDDLEYEVKLSKLDQEKFQEAMQRELENANVKVKDEDLEGVLEPAPAVQQ